MTVLTLIANQFGSGFKPASPLVAEAATDPGANLERIISNVLGFFTIIGGIIFVIYFIIAALEWTTAGSDPGKAANARLRMLHGIIGLIVLVATYGIVGLIGTIVGIDILNPAAELEKIRAIRP